MPCDEPNNWNIDFAPWQCRAISCNQLQHHSCGMDDLSYCGFFCSVLQCFLYWLPEDATWKAAAVDFSTLLCGSYGPVLSIQISLRTAAIKLGISKQNLSVSMLDTTEPLMVAFPWQLGSAGPRFSKWGEAPYMGFHSIIEGPHAVETVQQSLYLCLHNFVMLAISILKYCNGVMIICLSEKAIYNWLSWQHLLPAVLSGS